MKYKAVVFDLFGTLVDQFYKAEYEALLSDMAVALALPQRDFARLWVETYDQRATGSFSSLEANIEQICRSLGKDVETTRIEAAAHMMLDFTRRTLLPRPDAVETLAQLRTAGYKIGLISNCSSIVPDLWQSTPFPSWVDVPIFSSTEGLKKPHSQIYQLACKRLNVTAQSCLYVDDMISYLLGASQVGMYAVLIRASYRDTLETHLPDAEEWHGSKISTLKEVLTLV